MDDHLRQTGSSLSVSGNEVNGIQAYQCVMTYSGKTYTDTLTLTNKTDIFQATIESSGGDVFKNSVGTSTLLCRLFQNGQEVDRRARNTPTSGIAGIRTAM